jgi:MoaA/NifB/PqqE/SkfB family radical SAM enzyme
MSLETSASGITTPPGVIPHSAKRMEKLVLFTGFSCNAYCHFCIDLNKRDVPDKSTQQLVREMVQAKDAGVEYLEIIGGEATMRKDFLPLLGAAKKLGFKEIILVTNGMMLSYPDFAKKTVALGVRDIVFSIHGPNAEVHDAMTATPGSYDLLLKGLANVRKEGLKRTFGNCTVTQKNMKYIPDIARKFLELDIHHVEFIFVDPTYGGAFSKFDAQVPKISEAAKYMREALDIGRAGGTKDFTVRYVPLCHFTDYLGQVSEIREVQLFRTRHWAPDFRNDDVSEGRKAVGREKTAACEGCTLYNACEGMWTEYIKRRGDEELTPVTEQIQIPAIQDGPSDYDKDAKPKKNGKDHA